MNFEVYIRGYEYAVKMADELRENPRLWIWNEYAICENVWNHVWEIPLVILFHDEREIWPPKTEYFIST